MPEQLLHTGSVELCYETFGDPTDPTVLLVMGLGTQMIAWREPFCEQLAGRGFHVVRYDNRDVGRSTHLSDRKPPGLSELLLRRVKHPAYGLDDMADDAAGLLDGLGIEAAHVVGASMGGMIAQQLAVRHPAKVLSLVSIMSTTGASRIGQPGLRVLPFLAKPPAKEREEAIERVVALFGLIGSPGFERDLEDTRLLAGQSFDRSSDRRGAGRQLGAIIAAGDRTAGLRSIAAPTLVIHGTQDRMVNVSGGRATAKAIPDARLELIEGMGHDLPRGVWPRIIDLIASHARAAADRVATPSD